MPMPLLFSVVDSPRHPNLSAFYQRLGFEEVRLDSQRKAIAQLKKQKPDIPFSLKAVLFDAGGATILKAIKSFPKKLMDVI